MAIHRKLLDCFAALAFATLLWASPAAAKGFPPLTGRVVDQAGLLRPEQEIDLSSKSAALEAQTGRQFVVATVNSLEGREISDYAYRLGRAWKIGDEKRDDGVILLVAPNERKVWIATGYGAGAFLTDAMSGVITREAILPQFKKNPPDYGAGITAGADAIIKQMSLPPDEAQKNLQQADQRQKARQGDGAGFLPVVFVMIIFFMMLAGSASRRGRGRRYRRRGGGGVDPWVVLWGLNELSRSRGRGGWGGGGWGGGSWGGGGGGGFGGFSGGGGSFGGGGAGGSW